MLLRIALGLFFLAAGIAKLLAPEATAALIGARGLPHAHDAGVLGGVMEAAGGVLLLSGVGTRGIATLLMAYVVPVAVVFHFRSTGGFRAQAWNAALDVVVLVGLWHLIRSGSGRPAETAGPGARQLPESHASER